MVKNVIVFVVLNCLALSLWAQELGSWKFYLPARTGNSLAIKQTKVFVGTDDAFLYSYDKEDNSITTYTSNNGYANPNVNKLAYYADYDLMVVAYKNADVDLLFGDEFVYFPAIRLSTVVGDKTINHIEFYENYIYFFCAFGIVVYNIDANEVKDTYFLNLGNGNEPIKCGAIAQNKLFSGTDNGIFYIDIGNENIANPINWQFWESPINNYKKIDFIAEIDGHIYACNGKTIFSFNDLTGSWISVFNEEGNHFNLALEQTNNGIAILQVATDSLGVILNSTRIKFLDLGWNETTTLSDGYLQRVNEIKFANGSLWAADSWHGLIEIENEERKDVFKANSPENEHVFEMYFQNETLWIAPGGVSSNETYLGWKDGIYRFTDGIWKNYRIDNTPYLENVSDIVDVATSNDKSRVYFASHYNGMVVYENGQFINRFDQYNSPILPGIGDPGSSRIRALTVDENENVWMCNHLTTNPLIVYTADGQWQNLGGDFPTTELIDIVIDEYDNKWIATEHLGVIIYNSGDDILSTFDDEFVHYNKGDGDLEINEIRCLAIDKEGEIWMGTQEGVYVFYCPYAVFNDGCPPTRPIVDEVETGELGYLLRYEYINDIEIDAANRKWFATRNGVWAFDEDGKNQIHHFTTQNSPLLDDNVLSVAINNTTGEVYLGTAKGIVSYQGIAVEGNPTHEDKVLVYPNPVKPNYNGNIAFKGFANNAYVKITTINGDLVYQTKALGSQATWSGYMPNGVKAPTGVYLIFSIDETGNEKYAGKFAVVR